MAITSTLSKYLNKAYAMDGTWEETKHHRADNGQFTSGTGRGKSKGDDNGDKDGDESGERKEMSEEQATKIVRKAFEEAKCELKALKLVNHALNADVKEADEGMLNAINKYLTERGLKARIADKTTFKIAEDGYDDMQVVDDPMLEVLIDLCEIDMLAKDLHYRAKGRSFYGIHQLADLVKEIGDNADDLNEVYYMGEKGEEPPERSFVAAKAAELVGMVGGEEELLKALAEACANAASAVENTKKGGVASGTAAVLDEVSKKALQAKGLLARTMKSIENGRTIDAVVSKGVAIKPESAA